MAAQCLVVGLCLVASTSLAAAQSPIPVRQVTAPVGTDSGVLRAINNIRPLAGGRLLVNEFTSYRVLMFDSTMKQYTIVLDSAPQSKNHYGGQAGVLVPYLGDSTLFFDQQAGAFVLIDGAGSVIRAVAPIRSADNRWVMQGLGTAEGFDPKGGLIVRVSRPAPRPTTAPPQQDSGTVTIASRRDSSAIIRVDPETRAADTLGLVAYPTSKGISLALGNGSSTGSSAPNPFPNPDEWTRLPDGTVAIVRAHDYHIDWIGPGLSSTSTPKMAFDWKPIPMEERIRILDSLRRVDSVRRAAPLPPPNPNSPFGNGPRVRPPPVFFEPAELPDYYPPIRTGQVKSDPEGNVWILPTTSMVPGAGLTWDLVNRKGVVFERVTLPEGRNLIAIGPGGVLYLSYTPKGGQVFIERVTVIRPRSGASQ